MHSACLIPIQGKWRLAPVAEIVSRIWPPWGSANGKTTEHFLLSAFSTCETTKILWHRVLHRNWVCLRETCNVSIPLSPRCNEICCLAGFNTMKLELKFYKIPRISPRWFRRDKTIPISSSA